MGKTSTEVKTRYNERVYTAINIKLPKDLAKDFKEKCEKTGTPQRQVIIEAVERFLRDE